MGCAIIDLDDGPGMICGSGVKHCCICMRIAEYLCDYPMGKGKTCDALLCEQHAIEQGHIRDNQLRLFNEPPDPETAIHFCPAHTLVRGLTGIA